MAKLSRQQVEEQARRSAQGEPSSQSLTLQNLDGVNLSQLDLEGSDFTGSSLRSSTLTGSRLQHAKMERASLQQASLHAALLEGTSLRGANLRAADLSGAQLVGAPMDEAQLSLANLDEADLTDAVLDGALLLGATLRGTVMPRARLRSADLSRAVLDGADLQEADLANACLEQASLKAATLRNAQLFGADLRGADLRGADLLLTDLRGARFDRDTQWPAQFPLQQSGAILVGPGEAVVEAAGLRPGSPYPLGATWNGQGVNFAVYSRNASRVELCLFDAPDAEWASARLTMPEQTDDIWHVFIPHLRPGQLYGYRVHGRYDPARGLRFNPNKLLVDPYAKALASTVEWDDSLYGYRIGDPKADLSFDERNNARFVPKSIVIDSSFPWGDDRPPRTPLHRSFIYELHVKGFTQLHPGIPESMRGTYSALSTPVIIDYLGSLGVTAVELLPVHHHVDDRFLVEKDLVNYWGYNTLSYFAPDIRYSRQGQEQVGMQVREFKAMVKTLHAAGIEVILDVVYNHTAEGNQLGPTLSYRGFDNASYYRLVGGNERYYMDYTGCGNTLNVLEMRTLQLIMDSLRYWVLEMHVDGFRFDLAAALMRGFHEADRLSAFFDVISQDPVLSQVKLIAEPWDVGPGGYQVGNFPVQWSEWNGKYRDAVRRFWKGDEAQVGELAYRLSGSSDLYEHNGRNPYASVNFVTAHDGFTLRDLVSYNDKHNEANGEDNRDGERDNNSWNCGAEGPTTDPEVIELRHRQIRNLLATLLLSQGVPMLVAGDEFGRTQAGNNNAYCQDNDLSWLNWSLAGEHQELLDFTRRLVRLRQAHPALQRRRFLHGRRVHGADIRDILWLRPDGQKMSDEDWGSGYARTVGMLLDGRAMTEWSESGELVSDDALLCLFNAYWEPIDFSLPEVSNIDHWDVLIDTFRNPSAGPSAAPQCVTCRLQPRSLVVLLGVPPESR